MLNVEWKTLIVSLGFSINNQQSTIKIQRFLSDSLHRRIPNEFMNLESQASPNIIRHHPFRKLTGIEEAVGGVAIAGCVLAEGGRKKYCIHARGQVMSPHKLPREVVIAAVAPNELDFIVRLQDAQVLHAEAVGFAGIRTLHIYNLDHQ